MAASRIGIILAAATLLGVPPVAALAQEEPGPHHETRLQVGEVPPEGFTLESLEGETFTLAEALGERPLLLLFFRGTW